eukprot:9543754-Prorocentrum_lima.AAC.1
MANWPDIQAMAFIWGLNLLRRLNTPFRDTLSLWRSPPTTIPLLRLHERRAESPTLCHLEYIHSQAVQQGFIRTTSSGEITTATHI